jgi:hypothetical protein
MGEASRGFERIFPADRLTKRERVMRTVRHQPVDRVVLHEQLSYSTSVVSHFAARSIAPFGYTPRDVGRAVRQSLDTCFPIFSLKGTDTVRTRDGFVVRNDNWTSWRVARPFDDEDGAARWLRERTNAMARSGFNPHTAVDVGGKGDDQGEEAFAAERVRREYRSWFLGLQELVGDTVIIDFTFTGFCDLFDLMGLEIFVFFAQKYPHMLRDYMDVSIANELRRVDAVADPTLSPLILIPEDIATKHGPIFPPAFLEQYHFPYVQKLAEAWRHRGYTVIYHSDGNYQNVIPQLMAAGADGFYCLEPACGMDVIALKKRWPAMIWAGGLDGVDLMEKAGPERVAREVRRQIRETDALASGGLFMATSSEINPTIPAENFLAMVAAVGECTNSEL